MADGQSDGVIRRKLQAARAILAEGGPGADRGWRLALARAARDQLKLPLDVTTLALERRSLTELLEMPPERSLIAVLQGPRDGLGLLVLSPPVLSAMIEVQTIGKVSSGPIVPRRPTRTDAAMVATAIDAALIGLEAACEHEADLIWTGGFRYASFLDDPRPLGLLLDDIAYRVLTAGVSCGLGARTGQVLLALPAEGRGTAPALSAADIAARSGPSFAEQMTEQVQTADCVLQAVLGQVLLPLSRVLDLKVGEVLALPRAGVDKIRLHGIDGRGVASGKLGQQRGMRAIRLSVAEPEVRQMPQLAVLQPTDVAHPAAAPAENWQQSA